MEYPFYISKEKTGKVQVFSQNNRFVIECESKDPGEGIYKAYIVSDSGELLLGKMIPKNGGLYVRRQFTEMERRRYVPGKIVCGRGELEYAKKKDKDTWREVRDVSALFSDRILIEVGKKIEKALLKEQGDAKYLAVEIGENRPFPMMPLFCFAQVEEISGKDWAVFKIEPKEKV